MGQLFGLTFSIRETNGAGTSDEHKKLDARFVKNITIFDDTKLAPCSKFTKIWHVFSIRTLQWPQSKASKDLLFMNNVTNQGGFMPCFKKQIKKLL